MSCPSNDDKKIIIFGTAQVTTIAFIWMERASWTPWTPPYAPTLFHIYVSRSKCNDVTSNFYLYFDLCGYMHNFLYINEKKLMPPIV